MKIDQLSLAELRALQKKLEAEIPTKAAKAVEKATTEVRRVARAFDVSLDVLIEELKKPPAAKKKATRKKARKKAPAKRVSKVMPKYQHPEMEKVTWSGRGRKPKWVVAHLEAGKPIEELLIKKA